MDAADLPSKQLSMIVAAAAVRHLPDLSLPEAYVLRTYRTGDEEAWLPLLKVAGFDGWTAEKFGEYIEQPERREGSHCISFDNRLVAATFASQVRLDPPEGALDYVVAHPAHSGKKLGKIVCTAVLRYLVSRNYQHISLKTDDWRLPALKIYLDLGFRPILNRLDMPARWEEIYHQLGT